MTVRCSSMTDLWRPAGPMRAWMRSGCMPVPRVRERDGCRLCQNAPMFETGRVTTADPRRITSRDDFAVFAAQVLADYRGGGCREWENATLERFLDALAAVADARIHDLKDQEEPSWRLFAELLAAATVYE